MKRREHPIGVTCRGDERRGIVEHEQPGQHPNLRRERLQLTAYGPIAPGGEGTDVAGHKNAACLELTGKLRENLLGPPSAHDQTTAAAAQRLVEIRQALEQELGARARGVAAAKQARVKAEDGHHRLIVIQGRPKGGVVVEAEIAAEPEKRGHPSRRATVLRR